MESLPGYDHWKTGGAMPHAEDRADPYEDDRDKCPECRGNLRETTEGWYCTMCDWWERVGDSDPDPPGYDPEHPEM